jgi:hypothetical protein
MYQVDQTFLDVIDTENKAYLMGWIASDGCVQPGEVKISIHQKDEEILLLLRDLVCSDIPIRKTRNGDTVGLLICSTHISRSVCKHLSIKPGKKSYVVCFPELETEELKWHFLRGFFDGDGSVGTNHVGLEIGKPRCNITSSSPRMLSSIQELCNTKNSRSRDRNSEKVEWWGTHALDFLTRLYENSTIHLARKYEKFCELKLADWKPTPAWERWTPLPRQSPMFKWARTREEAQKPYKLEKTKKNTKDGYLLSFVEELESSGDIRFFDTGIRIQPQEGYCVVVDIDDKFSDDWAIFDCVWRIRNEMSESIVVGLVKTDPDGPELSLPARVVRIAPRCLNIDV